MQFLQSVDFLRVTVIWGPATFLLFMGLAVLASGNRAARGLPFGIAVAYAILCFGVVVLSVLGGEFDEVFMDILIYQLFGVAVVAIFLGAVEGIIALCSPRRETSS